MENKAKINIAVVDVAAQSSGALSVLNDFCASLNKSETKNQWYIITSLVKVEESKHLHNIIIPEIKRSWAHRIFWEKFKFPKLMKKLKIDFVISLQNNALPKGRWKQVVYFHNVLLLKHDINFSFFKREERKFFIYTRVLGPYIRHTWKNADKLYVQTETVKRKVKENGFLHNVDVVLPGIDTERIQTSNQHEIKGYIYPAAASSYKNHIAIIQAMKKINRNKGEVEIIFTIDGSENEYAAKIVEMAKGVSKIRCIGKLSRDELFHYYNEYGVIMVSKLESFGMPLLEAKVFQTVVVAIDYPYARELLEGYNRSYLVTEERLDQAIIDGMLDRQEGNYVEDKLNSWEEMIYSIEKLAEE
ncbi:MAG: glycosyltransferase [Turicibacter sp.]|nr:glycosyltransferase [Turicibacter sp.]